MSNRLDQALWDYHRGDLDAVIQLKTAGGLTQEVWIESFFRDLEDLPPQESMALALCRGKVLDLGAGTGSHSWLLQEQGIPVWALDRSAVAVVIMQERGVQQIIHTDIFTFEGQRFDTLLLLMNGIGLVQTLTGLDQFLRLAHGWIHPGGQILLDSTDVRADPLVPQQDLSEDPSVGSYPGEIVFEVEYRGEQGESIPWLYVDPETLDRYAWQAGWSCQVIFQESQGEYLARLIPVL